jgi:triphosphatase
VAHPPHKAEPTIVARKARVHELARASLHGAREQMRLNVRGARIGKDPGFVHQLRVGARRARVVVRLFRNWSEPSRARRLERDLRWISRLLGELRDRDVLLARLRSSPLFEREPPSEHDDDAHPSSERAAEALRQVEAELTRQRKVAARAASRALASKRFVGILRGLSKLSRAFDQLESSPRARKWARKRLQKRLDAVLALRSAVSGTDHEARHELRKELKKLRYTAELVRSLWRAKRVKHYLAAMSDLQDALGALNDAATGKRLLSDAAKHTGAEAEQASGALAAELERDLNAQLEPMPAAFAAFASAEPFWV